MYISHILLQTVHPLHVFLWHIKDFTITTTTIIYGGSLLFLTPGRRKIHVEIL